MDPGTLQSSVNATNNLDLSKLTDRDKQELQAFVMNESQKARIQSSTHILYPYPLLPFPPIHTYTPTHIYLYYHMSIIAS